MSGLAFKTLGGEGQDLVLIHGFGSDRLSWLGNTPSLMPLARVHALDLAGHGESSAVDVGDGSPMTLARQVIEALDAHGTGQAHLVGHSLGGGIAILIAAAKPERVLSLALVAPAGLGRGVDRDFLARYPELSETAEAEALLQRLVSRPMFINRFVVQRALEHLAKPGVRVGLRRIASHLSTSDGDLAAAAASISQSALPRLVMWGDADHVNPLDTTLLDAFGARDVIVPGAGHLPHIEAAKLANTELVRFIRTAVAR